MPQVRAVNPAAKDKRTHPVPPAEERCIEASSTGDPVACATAHGASSPLPRQH